MHLMYLQHQSIDLPVYTKTENKQLELIFQTWVICSQGKHVWAEFIAWSSGNSTVKNWIQVLLCWIEAYWQDTFRIVSLNISYIAMWSYRNIPLEMMCSMVEAVAPATSFTVLKPALYNCLALYPFTPWILANSTNSGITPCWTRSYITRS